MKSSPITSADLAHSVIAVPPLALDSELRPVMDENRKILQYLHAGGVTSYLYGGNANFFALRVSEYEGVLDLLESITPDGAWTIPSVGPDFGKALDQVGILKGRDFPTAMLLPMQAPLDPEGLATGIRRLADAFGRPLIVYLKYENYLTPGLLGTLLDDGVICSIKYAIERDDPSDDAFLDTLVDRVGTRRLVSGFGERPVIEHVARRGLAGFTSGSVCIAPRLSMAMLNACRSRDLDSAGSLWRNFVPLEDLRDAWSPIRVLHHAVAEAGIADTGPMLPWLSAIGDAAVRGAIAAAASGLFEANARS